MRVFVTGASGFIGAAVVQELLGAGHQVIGLARSDAAARSLLAAGAQPNSGSLDNLESLRRGAAAADGVIHLAYFHDINQIPLPARLGVLLGGHPAKIAERFVGAATQADQQAIETMGQALAGTDRPLVVAFGTLGMKAGQLASEDQPYDPQSIGADRSKTEQSMQALATLGVRSSVIRLPPVVHGLGDKTGFAVRFMQIAQKKRNSAYLADGLNRWPAVHQLDAAHLFRLALEHGSAGGTYHAVADESVAFREIAEVIGQRLGVPTVSKTQQQAVSQFGFLGYFAGVDNPTSSALTRQRLNWNPAHPGLLADLADPGYFKN